MFVCAADPKCRGRGEAADECGATWLQGLAKPAPGTEPKARLTGWNGSAVELMIPGYPSLVKPTDLGSTITG